MLLIAVQLGEVVEMGTHPELVAMGGVYAEMWSRQAEAASVHGSSASLASAAHAPGSSSAAADSAAGTAEQQPAAPSLLGRVVGATQSILSLGYGGGAANTTSDQGASSGT